MRVLQSLDLLIHTFKIIKHSSLALNANSNKFSIRRSISKIYSWYGVLKNIKFGALQKQKRRMNETIILSKIVTFAFKTDSSEFSIGRSTSKIFWYGLLKKYQVWSLQKQKRRMNETLILSKIVSFAFKTDSSEFSIDSVEKRKISYFVLARYLIQHWISPNQDDISYSARTFISGLQNGWAAKHNLFGLRRRPERTCLWSPLLSDAF